MILRLRIHAVLASKYHLRGWHADALKLNEALLSFCKAKLGPDHPETLSTMKDIAISLFFLNRGTEALLLIDDCLKRTEGKAVDPTWVSDLTFLRLRVFEKTKDAAGCRQTAEMWERLNRTDAESLCIAGYLRAVTAAVTAQTPGPEAARLADAEADRAMAWLHKAIAAGYRDFRHLLADADLAPLRRRADYADLLWDLADTPVAPAKP